MATRSAGNYRVAGSRARKHAHLLRPPIHRPQALHVVASYRLTEQDSGQARRSPSICRSDPRMRNSESEWAGLARAPCTPPGRIEKSWPRRAGDSACLDGEAAPLSPSWWDGRGLLEPVGMVPGIHVRAGVAGWHSWWCGWFAVIECLAVLGNCPDVQRVPGPWLGERRVLEGFSKQRDHMSFSIMPL